MKNLILLLILVCLVSCNYVHVKRDNELRLGKEPLKIDSSLYKFLKDTFSIDFFISADINSGSLLPNYSMVYGFKDEFKHSLTDSYLYENGCMSPTGVVLILKNGNKFYLVKSQIDLKKFFAPIESEEEALSYACVSTGLTPKYDFKVKKKFRRFRDTINTTCVIKLRDGFEINLFDYITCGCGPHTYLMIKYFVSKNGDIEKIQTIKLYENPEEDKMCVD